MLDKIFKNYNAWNVDEERFYKLLTMEARLKFILRYAILAPSSHNTQPWKFHVADNYIDIYADLSRKLAHSDPSGRMLYTALGCAVENIKITAAHFDLSFHIEYNSELKTSLPEHILRIHFSGAELGAADEIRHLFPFITRRASCRSQYNADKIPVNILSWLGNLSDEQTIGLCIITDREVISAIAPSVGRAMKAKMSIADFRNELAQWLRANLTLKRDGMPGSGHGMSLALSLIAPFVLRHKDVSDFEQSKAVKRVNNFPAVCIISSENDNALSWIKSGELLERLLLGICANKMSASIMAAPIEAEGEREKLQAIIGTQNKKARSSFPQAFIGFGFSTKTFPHSPRRKLEQVLV